MYDVSGQYRVIECASCGVLFINPQPTGEELKKHYPPNYYSYKSNPPPIYRGKNFTDKLITVLKHPIDACVSLLELFVRPSEIVGYNGRLLDIGCGQGDYLRRIYEIPNYNMRLYGVELENISTKLTNKEHINFYKGNFLDIKFDEDFFDVITMHHVLEHMEDPTSVFMKIWRILKKKGRLAITIPNTRSLAHFMFRKNWVQLDVPRHLFDYSVHTIKLLAKKTGFKVVKVRYLSSPFQFLGSLEYCLNRSRRKKVFLSNSRLINNKLLKLFLFPLSFMINILRLGDQLEIILKKSGT